MILPGYRLVPPRQGDKVISRNAPIRQAVRAIAGATAGPTPARGSQAE